MPSLAPVMMMVRPDMMAFLVIAVCAWRLSAVCVPAPVRWCVQAVPSADCLGGGVAGGRQHAVGAVPGGFAGDGLVQGRNVAASSCSARAELRRWRLPSSSTRVPAQVTAAVEGSGDDVESCQSVVSGGIEVAANAAPAGQGLRGVPVPGDSLMPFRGLDGLLGAVVRPLDAGLAGEQPGLIGIVAQPAAECVPGWLPS
jgi:hypothetical protein